MFTADYTIRKYLINKLAVIVNLQYPSKATVDDTTMVYIGDSSVQRTQIAKANQIVNNQIVPSTIRNLCEFRVEFVAVGQSFKSASDEIEKILEALYTSGFFDELNQQLPMPLFNIRIEDSLMTSQAEATETAYVHTQTLSFSYGE
ncbi:MULTISPECIES: hypothetical protein [Enterobacteriaceae]|uniref:hypothetical protein n=1 Tax=Enterobacteriaceae TaxID=543 RepID=UPI00059DEE6B|nr:MULTISPECIES: hypothetical protein [Enterobacteriaceae]OQD50814.1 hypothetical protein BWZ29_03060 [Enterobacter cancerogenus]HDX8630430.1 hypothetical protein [Klebsiella michiganensis]EHN8737309.1 hypothetical protein [Enterobacter hormaechei]EKS7423749.1 hypothetical protein [Enterobacter ludwigii]ELD6622459.1 hypothetical protein [Enterobacter cloacae]